MNILAIKKHLQLRPFDTTTEQGRSDERYRLALFSVFANILSKGMAMLVMVFSIKLTVPYLGAERFGAWMTIASFAGMLTFLDLGVGNALTNQVAHAASQQDKHGLQKTISGGLGFLFILGITMSSGLVILANIVPWPLIIKTTTPALNNEIRQACILFFALFGANIFTNGIQRVFAGLQQAFIAHLVSALGALITLSLLWYAASRHAGIPLLLISTLGCQSLFNLFALHLLIKRDLFRFSGLTPAIKQQRKSLTQTGALFFILQIGTMIGWGADNLIISSTLGASAVATYSITQRLFQFISQPLAIINAPLWGAYADAHAKGDKKFIKYTLKKSITSTIIFTSILGITILLYNEPIINAWSNKQLHSPFLLVLSFFLWTFCETAGNAFANLLNGCNIIKPQVVAVILLCTACIPLKIAAITAYGTAAMILTYTLTYVIIVGYIYGVFFRKQLQEIWQ